MQISSQEPNKKTLRDYIKFSAYFNFSAVSTHILDFVNSAPSVAHLLSLWQPCHIARKWIGWWVFKKSRHFTKAMNIPSLCFTLPRARRRCCTTPRQITKHATRPRAQVWNWSWLWTSGFSENILTLCWISTAARRFWITDYLFNSICTKQQALLLSWRPRAPRTEKMACTTNVAMLSFLYD